MFILRFGSGGGTRLKPAGGCSCCATEPGSRLGGLQGLCGVASFGSCASWGLGFGVGLGPGLGTGWRASLMRSWYLSWARTLTWGLASVEMRYCFREASAAVCLLGSLAGLVRFGVASFGPARSRRIGRKTLCAGLSAGLGWSGGVWGFSGCGCLRSCLSAGGCLAAETGLSKMFSLAGAAGFSGCFVSCLGGGGTGLSPGSSCASFGLAGLSVQSSRWWIVVRSSSPSGMASSFFLAWTS